MILIPNCTGGEPREQKSEPKPETEGQANHTTTRGHEEKQGKAETALMSREAAKTAKKKTEAPSPVSRFAPVLQVFSLLLCCEYFVPTGTASRSEQKGDQGNEGQWLVVGGSALSHSASTLQVCGEGISSTVAGAAVRRQGGIAKAAGFQSPETWFIGLALRALRVRLQRPLHWRCLLHTH
jgi:hypothetical protein